MNNICTWKNIGYDNIHDEPQAEAECYDYIIPLDTIEEFNYCPYCGKEINIA